MVRYLKSSCCLNHFEKGIPVVFYPVRRLTGLVDLRRPFVPAENLRPPSLPLEMVSSLILSVVSSSDDEDSSVTLVASSLLDSSESASGLSTFSSTLSVDVSTLSSVSSLVLSALFSF